jgi:hypothetical protein
MYLSDENITMNGEENITINKCTYQTRVFQ